MIVHAPVHDQLLAAADQGPFDVHARWIAGLLHAPIGLVTVLDNHRQHFAGMYGLDGTAAGMERGTPLSQSLCAEVVDTGTVLPLEDGRHDHRFRHHPAVRSLGIRAYLGVPLRLPDGSRIGSVCVADLRPRRWRPSHLRTVAHVRDVVESELAERLDRLG